MSNLTQHLDSPHQDILYKVSEAKNKVYSKLIIETAAWANGSSVYDSPSK